MLYTYDFKKVICIVGVAPIQGFADGTGIEVELDEDLFQKYTGADGDVSRSRRHGMGANAKFTLAQTSPSNDILSAIMLLDITANAGVVPLLIKDVLGTTKILSGYAWVKKPPAASYGKEVGVREWILDIATIEYFVGGNTPVLG
jgi:hypothetical protein